ncbi:MULTISPECIES: DUF692 family multinuclear iron-containing protein [Myxococcaceae]|uniref:multinuclear nonheme iron-dependent oxidase n=1 Tax=Myxococcaceae TaxID=31 RepID=UPI001E5AE678|nr:MULTISPECIES: DUF692 family multinuclear iron-containing protein [Myxococcaceae]
MPSLPWRGLGLSSNLSERDQPHPYRLLEECPGLFDYVEYSAPLSLDEARREASLFPEMWRSRDQVPVLFHPVHLNLYGPELESAAALAALDAHARAVGSPWVGNDVGWWHAGGQPFPGYLYFTPPLSAAGLADAAAHALHVQAGLSMPLALENPAVFARRGGLHVLDFMAGLHARTGLPLLLDLGHLLSFQLSAGLPAEAGLDGFPLDRVIELHLAGGVVTRRGSAGPHHGLYVDDHTQPVREELFALLERLLPRCSALRAVTFEGDGHPPEVAALTLRRLRGLLPAGARADLSWETPVASAPQPGAAFQTRPWELFEEGYSTRPPASAEDVSGARAEQDFRLAVVAEALDRDWPLTRLLLAGDRAGLAAFTGSRDFRELFEGLGRSLGHAFASYARRTLRARPDEGASAALAFETFLPQAFARPVVPPAAGELSLAPDVRVGHFPADLTELVFAARSLRRHLTGRAWACEALELSGLEALAQVAARPAPGPWTFAVRRRAGGLEVLTVPSRLGLLLRALAAGPQRPEALEPALAAQVEEGLARGLLRRGVGEGARAGAPLAPGPALG